MSVGLLVGGAFLGMAGGRLMRNYLTTEDDTKAPDSMNMRKTGLMDRLMANPVLMAQYNEKYIQKKLSHCSGVMDNSNKLTIGRSMSLKKTAATEEERSMHGNILNGISVPASA